MYSVSKIRSIKHRVEENSKVINEVVDTILSKYIHEIEDIMVGTKQLIDQLKHSEQEISDIDLERLTLQLPVYYYFACSGLEELGVESDTAQAIKDEIFNNLYLEAEGTIQDKTKAAELHTFNERMVEVAYQRAYKKLKVKLDAVDKLFSATKKIISKRMQERDIQTRELP